MTVGRILPRVRKMANYRETPQDKPVNLMWRMKMMEWNASNSHAIGQYRVRNGLIVGWKKLLLAVLVG